MNTGIDHPTASSTEPITDYSPQSKSKTTLALQEEKTGTIQFRVVCNDGTGESMQLLTGLKNIFQKQLPKMPKEYIARLVYDKNHFSMAVVRHPLKVLGGITYRPFSTRKFAEIVFCAIDTESQVKGFGARLMCHVKDYVRIAHDVHHFLTYADNYAIGYFKKQGFTSEITLDKSIWMGYIKDYEGGTIMHCAMLPKVEYLSTYEIITTQRKAVFDKIRQMSKSHIVYPGIKEKNLKIEQIPGLVEAGWRKDLESLIAENTGRVRNPIYTLLKKMVTEAKNHESSWPFAEPVAGVPDYYDVIKDPMDLGTLEERIEVDLYKNIPSFEKDLYRIFSNCKIYNEEGSPYYKCAVKMEFFCKKRFKELIIEMGFSHKN